MQTILTAQQMRLADEHTISQRSISSLTLMEEASRAFVNAFLACEADKKVSIHVFAGQGNNGGDGLAIARLLQAEGYPGLQVSIAAFTGRQSADFSVNLARLKEAGIEPVWITVPGRVPDSSAVVIDALFGSGLNRPLDENYNRLAAQINHMGARVYAVDVPSGLASERPFPGEYNGVRALRTFTFQRPKRSFFLPESAAAQQAFEVLDIGLDERFIESQHSDMVLLEPEDMRSLLRPRKPFSHKGTYGHALLVAGSPATMGAALLAAKGCLNAGAGLTTLAIPASGLTALNTALPEVMALPEAEMANAAGLARFSVLAAGPGLGTDESAAAKVNLLLTTGRPLLLDADALNILADRQWLDRLPCGSVLTPHMKEFDRLFGPATDWNERLENALGQATARKITIVLKNQYTFVVPPGGRAFVNPTGDPAMAQGGMGDVLTGILAALLAQGYAADDACKIGCYIHGAAGMRLASQQFVVSASAVAAEIPAVLKHCLLN
ncbi:bifunctional ADP-dependent NAD(P)H-hydrate dehydratase/NAD(P)H-hydrate epimerase [Pedobacter yulinensis]|uniref:Bifunctional NAD(P)H-hydrate repair enzyme n=1 Tax=Pedobacter yulinensis TaxID=2126353 RepID=A0A2T3HPY4_9SPHI|nr:NAD(P)H-hydrate dehydratase [Pedobacter yulinensis]PST84525.1 bifunctional ADP-dependent NAD(P)H-hydrate dehydratase/NAD(P)H-hydrate epimerase [Pedobacter yulinensis]